MYKILVTGAAGFIGYHLCEQLLSQGHHIIGVDSINDYYDVALKYGRLNQLGIKKDSAEKYNTVCVSSIHGTQMQFVQLKLEDRNELPKIFDRFKFDIVCNLAAQAGVRYSLENPESYIDSNSTGFLNVLECCRHKKVTRLVYASSSSVYGNSKSIPFNEHDNVDNPVSLYAATKKANELMAYTYSHLYDIETIGLRFFTVYGPWGRPDMAIYLFTDAILKNKPIKVFNEGNLSRDFTYIDDIIQGVTKTLLEDSKNENSYKLYNIGNNKPIKLMDFIHSIEMCLGKKAKKLMLPMQPGEMEQTWADVTMLHNDYNYKPNTALEKGVKQFIDWYKVYHNA